MPPSTPTTDTEERIFAAALHVFARKGKEGARMQEIADAAQINKAMLHYYFRSKDRLYEEALRFVFRRSLQTIGEMLGEQDTFADMLRVFIDSYIDYIAADDDKIRLMVNENLSGGAVLRRIVEPEIRERLAPPRQFVEQLEAAIAAGEVRPVDPFQTLLTTISGCLFFLVMYPFVELVVPGAAADREAFIAARKAHLFDLLYNGLKA